MTSRTTEIGIRMSLGADSRQVQQMILKEGGVLVVIGLVLGVTGAFFAGRLMRGLLFGVAPHDPLTLIGVALMITGSRDRRVLDSRPASGAHRPGHHDAVGLIPASHRAIRLDFPARPCVSHGRG